MASSVYLDYRGRDGVPGMVVGGMTVVERALREAQRAGADKAFIHVPGNGAIPMLPPLGIEIEVRGETDAPPPDATPIDGTTIAGVAISDEGSRRRASRALWRSCRRPYDGLGDKYVIRGISTRLSRILCRIGATPNQVTVANIAIGIAACVVVLFGTQTALIVAGALMFAQVVLDSCDGELARIRFMHSRLGMILDNGSDDLIDNLFVAMLALHIGGIWALIGVAAACARAFSALMIHIDVARRGKAGDILAFKWFFDTEGEQLADRFETKGSVAGTVRAFGRRDLYVLVWTVTCIAGVPLIGLVLSIALSTVYFCLAITHLVVMRRR
ncbi:MAG: CDP-alcohol phosphatidyltransferase family protein [Myxococcota bacterium]|nr:CDP-alcohol phosphatidyltransferase family protein [Myxococcota bacterium]